VCSYFALGFASSNLLAVAVAVAVAYVLVQVLCDTSSELPLSGVHLACSKKFLYSRVSQTISFWIPSELYLLAWPHRSTLRRSCYIWKYFNFFHIVDLYIKVFYITFIYHTISFLNNLLRHNTLCTNKVSNIQIITGIAFRMLLGPDERLQDRDYPVAVWSVISEVHLSSQHQDGYVLLTANKSSGKRNKKTRLLSVLRETQDGREYLIQSWVSNISFMRWSIVGPLETYCWPLIFCHFTVAPYKFGVTPSSPYGPL